MNDKNDSKNESKKNWTLITGATGFVGGEWTLRALLRGEYVAALVRPETEINLISWLNTLADLHACARPSFDRLVIQTWNLGDESACFQQLRKAHVNHITSVIHSAADMTYSLQKLPRSLQTNLNLTLNLYQAVCDHSPETKKFILLSTAYTCGFECSDEILETLHLKPQLINSYQTSKWATEMALTLQAQQISSCLKLVIIRPSIVIGETDRGIYTGKSFGFYMFLKAFAFAKKAGAKKLQVKINPQIEINLLPLNHLLKLLDILRYNSTHGFVHATLSHGVLVEKMMQTICNIYEIKISSGAPRGLFDRIFNQQVSSNQSFANTTFKFQNTMAQTLLPELNWQSLSDSDFEKIVRYSKSLYFKNGHFKTSDLQMLPQLLPAPARQFYKKFLSD